MSGLDSALSLSLPLSVSLSRNGISVREGARAKSKRRRIEGGGRREQARD